MYLKEIELENFKSFGGKLSIPLMEGYTAVTGPNGSGKSNISDAILFVLGPRSSKAIRAGRLSDLIFDGGKSKNPANYTKVSLIFDNQDRLIPWDSDLVKLTRLVRMSQSGEGYNSYFYVNDNKSTLTEFDNLLSSARISAEGYNLVQQGDVTRIVEMGNIERRKILESISGISRFDGEIERAQNERKQAEENIERISIIITELERQLEQLEEERGAALEYMAIKSRLEMAKAQLSHKTLEATLIEASAIQEQIEAYDQELEELYEDKSLAFNKISVFDKDMRLAEAEIEKRGGKEYQELKEKMNSLRVDMARQKDRSERNAEGLQQSGEEQASLREEITEVQEEKSLLLDRISASQSELSSKNAMLDARNEEYQSLRADIEGRGDGIAAIQKAINGLEEEIGSYRSTERELDLSSSRVKVKLEELDFQIAGLEENIQSAEFEFGDAEWNLREIKSGAGSSGSKLQELSVRFHDKRKELQELEAESQEIDQAIRRLGRELEALKAQKSAAENLEKGYNRAVSAILELRDEGKISGIHGTVAELAEVDRDYETALNVAAGARMQAIVVEDDEVASLAIEHLKRNRLGRVTFLPLSKMRDGRPRAKAIMIEKECVGYAINLIRFDPRFRVAFWHVLSDTLVVKDMTQARELMGGVRLVTMAGEVLESSGAMVGGTLSRGNVRFGAVAEDKLESVRSELNRANQSDGLLRDSIAELKNEIKGIEDDIRTLQGSNSDIQAQVRTLEIQRDDWGSKRDALKKELSFRKGSWQTAKEEEKSALQELESIRGRLNESQNAVDEKRQELSSLAPDDVQKELHRLQEDIFKLSSESSKIDGDLKGLRAEKTAADKRCEDLNRALQKSERNSEEQRSACELSKRLHHQLTVELEASKLIEASMEGEVQELRDQRDEAYRSKVAAESEREQIEERISVKKDFRIGLKAKVAMAEERAEQIRQEIGLIDFEVRLPLPSMEELKRTIKTSESKMSQMGAVNLRAVEDYDTKFERHERFIGEVSRLEDQRKELLSLMNSLEMEKKEIFQKVFVAVDHNFRRVYDELSGGGEAFLALENEEFPFEGGMLIKAQPKNGKMLRLEALSGGEKSLTALAFIFAIQEHQPSPFYLLDEVDMFLDSVNAEMVARRIQKSASKAQFVQISLRKVTLGKAEHLYGVTRQPNGVSKVIIQPDIAAVSRYEGLISEEVKT